VDTDEKKQDCFINELNDGLAYALEARDFGNCQDMVNKSLVLENYHGIMEATGSKNAKVQVATTPSPRLVCHLLDISSMIPINRPEFNSSRDPKRQCKAIRLHSSSSYYATTAPRLLLREVKMCSASRPFRGQCRTLGMKGATIVVREDTSPVLVPSRATASARCLPQTQPPIGTATPLLW
jgi:hypothetical protein